MICIQKPWGEKVIYEHVIVKLNRKDRYYKQHFNKYNEGYFFIHDRYLAAFKKRKEIADLKPRSRQYLSLIPITDETNIVNDFYDLIHINLRHIEYIKVGKKKIKLKDFFEERND